MFQPLTGDILLPFDVLVQVNPVFTILGQKPRSEFEMKDLSVT